MKKTILLAGGTGFVGTRLAEMLKNDGHEVRLLSRRADRPRDVFGWNPALGQIDLEAVRGVHAVVNLAGAGVADGRWTAARKRLILDSRVQSAQTLRDAFLQTGQRPEVYVSASAIGFYGNSGEKIDTENDPPGSAGFLPEVCVAWEKAADEIAALGIRTVKLRIGIVLAEEGGALREIVKPLRFGLGTFFGDGRAWYSWIHRDDICRMIAWAVENQEVTGVFNAVAPNPVRNLDLVKSAAAARRQAAVFLPAPAFVLRLILGEMADAILDSQRVSAAKVVEAGFKFDFPEIDGAMRAIFRG